MLTGIDHLIIALPDLDAAVRAVEGTLGLAATGGGRHEKGGTENRLVWFGDTYLELLGVWDPALASEGWLGAPTIRAAAAGGGLASWVVTTADVAAEVDLVRARGMEISDATPGERHRPDGRIVRWVLAHPPRVGPLLPPFMIEHDPAGAEWTPGERAERATFEHPVGGRVRVERLEIPVADTNRASIRYLPLGIGPFRPSLAGGGARDAVIGSQTLRLVPAGPAAEADPDAPVEVTIALRVERTDGRPQAAGVREERLLGCRWLIREVAAS